jgi:8-oxo-(d)GTP phosphatase
MSRAPVAIRVTCAPMELLVVRHAHAGAKDRWRGEDRLRPLSLRGRSEALALVDLLAPYGPTQVVSSPLLRCVQTVEPLATYLGLVIEETEALGPQADRDAVRLLRSLRSAPHPVVVCTHGETIEALQRRLARPGKLAFGPGGAHEKGSVWLLHATRGRLTSAMYLPPGAPPYGGHASRRRAVRAPREVGDEAKV